MYVREFKLYQKSGVIDVVAKYGEPRVAEIEVRAVRRRRSCQQVTTGSSSLVRLSNMVEGMPAGAKFLHSCGQCENCKSFNFFLLRSCAASPLFLYAVTEVASDFHEILKNCLNP